MNYWTCCKSNGTEANIFNQSNKTRSVLHVHTSATWSSPADTAWSARRPCAYALASSTVAACSTRCRGMVWPGCAIVHVGLKPCKNPISGWIGVRSQWRSTCIFSSSSTLVNLRPAYLIFCTFAGYHLQGKVLPAPTDLTAFVSQTSTDLRRAVETYIDGSALLSPYWSAPASIFPRLQAICLG
jgi:hypothetical protein